MPLYVWKCKGCQKEQEVLVMKVSDWDTQPEEPCCETPDRERIQGGGVGTAYGLNWTPTSYQDGKGGKGNW